MEALEFLKERKRMCRSSGGSCRGCPCEKVRCALNSLTSDDDYKRIVVMVEEWSAAHPRKTRQSVFLEQYPEARIGDDGVLQIYPCSISASHRNARSNCVTMGHKCTDCRREFWLTEVEL